MQSSQTGANAGEPEPFGFALTRGNTAVRTRGREHAVLTARGWVKAGWLLRCVIRYGEREAMNKEALERRLVRACCKVVPDADLATTWRARARRSGLLWWLSPPLPLGAPRFVARRSGDREAPAAVAERAYLKSLGGNVTPALIDAAIAGLERTRDRVRSIDSRAGVFLSAAGLTGTLVLANSALLFGDRVDVDGTALAVATAAIGLAAAALVVTGLYALAALMWTFGQIDPNNARRILERSRVGEAEARREHAAALVLARRRLSLVGDWKVARLKRATAYFVVTVALVAVASAALVVGAT